MSLYTQSKELRIAAADAPRGRVIVVRDSTGSDSTGDGSISAPYQTLARAVQDLRSGANDTILWFREGGALNTVTPSQQPANTILVSGVDDWSLIGVGLPSLGTPSSNLNLSSCPTLTRITVNRVSFDAAGNSLTTSDRFYLSGYTESSGNLINGFWRLFATGDPTVELATFTEFGGSGQHHTVAASGAGEPFASGGGPTDSFPLAHMGLALDNCDNVRIAGMAFLGSGIGQAGGLLVRRSNNVLVSNCLFENAILGLIENGATLVGGASSSDLIPRGFNMQVEQTTWQSTYFDAGTGISLGGLPRLALDHGKDLQVNECTFFDVPLFGNSDQNRPIRYHGNAPATGYLFTANRVIVPQLFQASAANLYGLAHFGGTHDTDSPLVRFVKNLYTGVSARLVQVSTDVPTKVDIDAQSFVNEDSIPQQVADSIYGEAIHIDTTGAGSSGTLRGINGTPTNPVDNLADARVLADALGFTTYEVRGALTVDQDHIDWTFLGRNPNVDVITIDAATDVSNSGFERTGVRGDFSATSGAETNGTQCIVGATGGTVRELFGLWVECNFLGTIVPKPGDAIEALRPASTDILGTTFDFESTGSPTLILLGDAAGVFSVVNMDQANHVLGVTLNGAQLTLAASVTNGIVQIGGVGQVIDNKGAAESAFTTFTVAAVARQEVTVRIDQVTDPWQEVVSDADGNERARFELFDQDGNAINNANPLGSTDVTFVGERRRVTS